MPQGKDFILSCTGDPPNYFRFAVQFTSRLSGALS